MKSKNNLDPTKIKNVEGGILAMLFRIILQDTNNVNSLDFLAKTAESEENKKVKLRSLETSGAADQTSKVTKVKTKTQIVNQATADTMTFKVFLSLLRMLFGVTGIQLSIRIKRANGKESVHETPFINLIDNRSEDDDEEE